ncbi:MAG: peptide-methionine (R)-S-oxide reductase MsrB [Candidatus Eremiobacteraeota bacterium]|nr:peptide-methionine (R)-S-oxide reductase MsrB [Candidatus Eremiobacteraeota bacterium]MBC5804585.1 peptide-methionine (R)-S-oxide reductase MsrB [Candidatus Eremiobacteraeota bacterium]MBC5822063.1 peptide-methionine (R)-S-oxide reductase MsrB [Candidatus Eremiobacteraeota bacterium]
MSRGTMLAAFAGVAASLEIKSRPARAVGEHFEIHHTDKQWHAILDSEQYAVLRDHGTEPPASSPLDEEKRVGSYLCAGCNLALFDSATKFDSGTGWPSFYRPLPHAVETSRDNGFMLARTEVHCRRCGGHLGHVFNDGPPPTGLRYCMNGVALEFHPHAK